MEFKAGGGESFGYEPHLLWEMSLERKAKKKAGHVREGEGRMVHRADVLKDREWVTNGKVYRFSDKDSYREGGFADVWQAIKPHFLMRQEAEDSGQIATGVDSTELISETGGSAYYEDRSRRDIMVAEVTETLNLLWGGTAVAAKTMRVKAIELVFGFKSKEALERVNLATIERGLRIFQAFEKLIQADRDLLMQPDDAVLAILREQVDAYDKGDTELDDLAF